RIHGSMHLRESSSPRPLRLTQFKATSRRVPTGAAFFHGNANHIGQQRLKYEAGRWMFSSDCRQRARVAPDDTLPVHAKAGRRTAELPDYLKRGSDAFTSRFPT